MAEPLSKEERDEIDVRIAKMYRVHHQTETHETLAQAIRRYEATVQDRDDRIVALEAEVARLRPLAEVGEAVEGMADAAEGGLSLETPHRLRPTWRLWGNHMGYRRTLVAEAETLSALFATIKAEDAALRAAKGETDE